MRLMARPPRSGRQVAAAQAKPPSSAPPGAEKRRPPVRLQAQAADRAPLAYRFGRVMVSLTVSGGPSSFVLFSDGRCTANTVTTLPSGLCRDV